MADPLVKKRDRVRRNRPPETTLVEDGSSGLEAPPLPDELELLETTRAWWVELWDSPIALLWKPLDVPALVRLAILTDKVLRGSTTSALLEEIRALEDRFGLSPLARKRLAWEIGKAAEGAPAKAAKRKPASGAKTRRLRAV